MVEQIAAASQKANFLILFIFLRQVNFLAKTLELVSLGEFGFSRL